MVYTEHFDGSSVESLRASKRPRVLQTAFVAFGRFAPCAIQLPRDIGDIMAALLPIGERGPSDFWRVAVDYDVGAGVGVGGSSRKSSRTFSTKSFTVYSDTRT